MRGISRTWRPLAMVALLASIAPACHGPPRRVAPHSAITFRSPRGTVALKVQIAATQQARSRGLMGVGRLAPDAGMAFVYAGPQRGPYWMKDTLIPLSIAFWGPEHRILAILDMAPCRADPCALYDPGVPYVGAVEANRGYFAAHGISKGDTVVVSP